MMLAAFLLMLLLSGGAVLLWLLSRPCLVRATMNRLLLILWSLG